MSSIEVNIHCVTEGMFAMPCKSDGTDDTQANLNETDAPRQRPCGTQYANGVGDPLASEYYDENDLNRLGIQTVGTNVRVAHQATIVGLANVSLGSNIRIDSHVVILARRGPLQVGNNVHIEPGSSIVCHAGVKVGNFCTLSHGVRVFTASADYSGEHFTNVFPDERYQSANAAPIVLHDHVIIGGNSVVMPGVRLGEGAAIGALSFVRHSLEGWAIYGGNPLRKLGKRSRTIKAIGDEVSRDLPDVSP